MCEKVVGQISPGSRRQSVSRVHVGDDEQVVLSFFVSGDQSLFEADHAAIGYIEKTGVSFDHWKQMYAERFTEMCSAAYAGEPIYKIRAATFAKVVTGVNVWKVGDTFENTQFLCHIVELKNLGRVLARSGETFKAGNVSIDWESVKGQPDDHENSIQEAGAQRLRN